MPIPVPAGTVEFNAPLSVLPANWNVAPDEGDRVIPIEIDWSKGPSQHVNVQGLATQPFKKIVAAFVNNVENDSTVSLIFSDTVFKLDIPAGTSGLFPIATSKLDFVIVSANAAAADVTYIQLFNSQPPPVAISAVQIDSSAASAGIAINAASTPQLVAAGINGNLTAIDIMCPTLLGGAANDQVIFTVEDGNGDVLFEAIGEVATGVRLNNVHVLTLTGISVPFTNGLKVAVTSSGSFPAAGSDATINITYQT